MRIAMLGIKSVPAPGGIATYTEQISARLVARGHEVVVYCRPQYVSDDESRPLAPYRGIERRLCRGVRGKYLDAPTHTFSSALDTLRRDFDVIHIHGSAPGVVIPLLRLRRSRPVVVTIHSLDWEGRKWGRLATGVMSAAGRVPVRLADEMTVVSRRLQRYYRDRFGRETVYIPSGVEIPERRSAQEITRRWGLEEGGYILFVGRLTPEKGLEHLIPAYGAIETDRRLVIVGGANFEDPYITRLHECADDRVVFTDYQSGDVLSELYSNAYIYVQPSTLEGISMAVLEALSYGRCVLASDIPGNVEALGECGHTFAAGDVEDLREKLEMLLESPSLVEVEVERAVAHVRREHDWESTTDGLERVYESVTAGEDTRTDEDCQPPYRHQTADVVGRQEGER